MSFQNRSCLLHPSDFAASPRQNYYVPNMGIRCVRPPNYILTRKEMLDHLLVVACSEVLYGDGPCRARPKVGKEPVFLENGQWRAVRGVANNENAWSWSETLCCFGHVHCPWIMVTNRAGFATRRENQTQAQSVKRHVWKIGIASQKHYCTVKWAFNAARVRRHILPDRTGPALCTLRYGTVRCALSVQYNWGLGRAGIIV